MEKRHHYNDAIITYRFKQKLGYDCIRRLWEMEVAGMENIRKLVLELTYKAKVI